MPLIPSISLLFVHAPNAKLGDYAAILHKWGYQVEELELRKALAWTGTPRIVLCDFQLSESFTDALLVDQLIERCKIQSITFLFFSVENVVLAGAFYPVVPLSNLELLRDYLRLKCLENEPFRSHNEFTKSLLKKDLERERSQLQVERILAALPRITERMSQKSLLLSRRGWIISASPGMEEWSFLKMPLRRHELLADLHPDDAQQLRQTLMDFVQRKTKHTSLWIRHKSGSPNYRYFKLYVSNYFDLPDFDFALLQFEAHNIGAENLAMQQRLHSWLPDLVQHVADSSSQDGGFHLASLMPLFARLGEVNRILVLGVDEKRNVIRQVSEWCKTAAFFQNSADALPPNYPFHSELRIFLDKYAFLDVQMTDLSVGGQSRVFDSFAHLLGLRYFIPVPILSKDVYYAYLLLDMTPNAQKNDEEGTSPPHLVMPDTHEQIAASAAALAVDSYPRFDFLNFLPIPISIKDEQHRWVMANNAMCDFLGKSASQVVGRTDYELFKEDEANVFWETDDLVLEEEITFQNEEYIYTNKGEQRIVVTNKSIFKTPSGSKMIISTMKDVTRLNEIEKDLRERTEKLRKSERKLKSLNSTKDRFFSIIAHDLKNPFNTLVGFTNILSEDIDQFEKAEIEEFIKILSEAAQSGYKLLENLLDWARTQTGKFQFEPITLNLRYLIDECIALLSPQADRKNIKLYSTLKDSLYAFGDSNMVELVVRNLLSNAIKFTNFGGEVRIEAIDLGEKIELSVTDNGVGMAEEDLVKLFRIDVEFSNMGTDSETGTGLGLILCKEFVEKNGGEIQAESEQGKGSRFFFTLNKQRVPVQ